MRVPVVRNPISFWLFCSLLVISGCGSGLSTSNSTSDTTATTAAVKFSVSLQPIFDEPLKSADLTSTNNVSCVFCHSPAVPVTGSGTSQATCSASTSSDCNGRANSSYYVAAANSFAAGAAISTISGTLMGASSAATFPKGGASSTARVSFANAFVKTYSGYSFDCSKVKALLELDVARAALSAPIDPTQSLLYKKLQGAAGITGAQMPKNDATKASTDAYRNPNTVTQAQLDLLARWYNEGADCTQ